MARSRPPFDLRLRKSKLRVGVFAQRPKSTERAKEAKAGPECCTVLDLYEPSELFCLVRSCSGVVQEANTAPQVTASEMDVSKAVRVVPVYVSATQVVWEHSLQRCAWSGVDTFINKTGPIESSHERGKKGVAQDGAGRDGARRTRAGRELTKKRLKVSSWSRIYPRKKKKQKGEGRWRRCSKGLLPRSFARSLERLSKREWHTHGRSAGLTSGSTPRRRQNSSPGAGDRTGHVSPVCFSRRF
ncbi:hypothetical protein EDB86DRAFT_218202 [Lactarius hatsudake]|nr:hypothetical protein EDB86DRAFT_218202 [Lactarius hatsudake]